MKQLNEFLEKLAQTQINYTIERKIKDDAIMRIVVRIPNEIWEIEFMVDGSKIIEIFKSCGEIKDEKSLDTMFEKYGD